MSRVQLPPAQKQSGRYVGGNDSQIDGVYSDEAMSVAVTLYTTAEGSTEVTYPLTADDEGVYQAFGEPNTVFIDYHYDTLNNPARVELVSGWDAGNTLTRKTPTPVFSLTAPTSRLIPGFTRLNGGDPIMRFIPEGNDVGSGAVTGESGFWHWPMSADELGISEGDRLDEYYLFYSTDHRGAGGLIFFATAPTPVGPWVKRNGDGTLVGGTGDPEGSNGTVIINGSETPSVVRLPDGKIACYSHRGTTLDGVVGQRTRLHVADPTTDIDTGGKHINFTFSEDLTFPGAFAGELGYLDQYPLGEWMTPTSIHTGYHRVFYLGNLLCAVSLWRGEASLTNMVWVSTDGYLWRPFIGCGAHAEFASDGTTLAVENRGEPFIFNGQDYMLTVAGGPYVAGSGDVEATATLVAVPYDPATFKLTGKPVVLRQPVGDFEGGARGGGLRAYTDPSDGRVYVYWITDPAGDNYRYLHIGVIEGVSEQPAQLTPPGAVSVLPNARGERPPDARGHRKTLIHHAQVNQEVLAPGLIAVNAVGDELDGSNGSVTYQKVSDGERGAVRFTTDTNNNNEANLWTAFSIDTSKFRALYLTLKGLTFDGPANTDSGRQFSTGVFFTTPDDNDISPAHGVTLWSAYNDSTDSQFRVMLGSNTFDETSTPMRTSRYGTGATLGKISFCMAVYPLEKVVALYDGDVHGRCIAWIKDEAQLVLDDVRVGFRIRLNQAGTAHWFEFSEFLLEGDLL